MARPRPVAWAAGSQRIGQLLDDFPAAARRFGAQRSSGRTATASPAAQSIGRSLTESE